MRKALYFLTCVFAVIIYLGLASGNASAQAPTITSFDISPTSGASGFPFALTWALQDAGGSALLIPCFDGVRYKKSDTGANIACDSNYNSTAAGSAGILIKFINISGLTKTIPIKLIPKDSSGIENNAQNQTISVTISADPEPITSFTSSVSTTEIGKPITLSWNIPEAIGANISIECKNGVNATSPSYTGNIPCGKQIFSTALQKTGNLILNFTNSTLTEAPVKITLFPQISAGIYNGINTGILTIDVASDYIPDPIVNFFKTSAPSTTLYSGENLPISWSTEYTSGVNLKISCATGITATSSQNPDTKLPCENFAFSELLATSSNLTISFKNDTESRKAIVLSLVPSFKNKIGYDATKTKTISLEIRAKSNSPVTAPSATPTIAATAQPNPPQPSPTPSIAKSTSVSPQPTSKTKTPVMEVINPSTDERIVPTHPKDMPSVLKKLFEQPENEKMVGSTPINPQTKEDVSKILIETKQLDVVETILPNPVDSTYTIMGRVSGKFLFLIHMSVKINLIVDSAGNIKKTEKPWWSFLVRFK